MRGHVHHFYRWSIGGRAFTKWRCSCGLKTNDTKVITLLDGRGAK